MDHRSEAAETSVGTTSEIRDWALFLMFVIVHSLNVEKGLANIPNAGNGLKSWSSLNQRNRLAIVDESLA
jgi:hypothetical protein